MTPANKLKILAVTRSAETKAALHSAIEPNNGTAIDVLVGELKALAREVSTNAHHDVLILDVDVDDLQDLEALRDIKKNPAQAQVPIIATSEKLSMSAMRRLLREGVTDFLPQPLAPAELIETLQVVARKLRSSDRGGKGLGHVFSFIKAAGGMGATTLAVHTACALATKRRRRDPDKRVCLIDLDVQFGGAALYLDLENSSALVEMVRSPERLDNELLQRAMVTHQCGFDVLTAPQTPMPLNALYPEAVAAVIELARMEYDYVVIDLPHALTNWTEVVLSQSSAVCVVTQLTVPAIRQTRKLLDILHEEGHYALPLSLILNRYKRSWGTGVRLRQAQKALDHKFDHFVPNDYDLVMSAVNQGVPVNNLKRFSRFGKSIRTMTEKSVSRIEWYAKQTETAAAE